MNADTYQKGELVPGPGTYRCTVCGEEWTINESNVRFPPCEVDKTGTARWVKIQSSEG
jgi:hypothetical protein